MPAATAHSESAFPEIRVLGAKVSLLDTAGLVRAVGQLIAHGGGAVVASGNPHAFNLAYEHAWYRDFLNAADIVHLDGFGLRLGARLLGRRTPPRSTWADFAWPLAAAAEQAGHRLFLFGGREGVAAAAAGRLCERHPRLQIAGVEHGYHNWRGDPAVADRLVETINAAAPDILIVGLGMPLQEDWIRRHRDRLRAGVIMTAGGAFDFISGRMRRAPAWMRALKLEWLFRLLLEPRRMWRRYLVGNPLFLWRVWRERRQRNRWRPR